MLWDEWYEPEAFAGYRSLQFTSHDKSYWDLPSIFSQEEEVKVQQEEEEVQELVAEVASLPPPDPRFGMLRTLGEEQASQLQ